MCFTEKADNIYCETQKEYQGKATLAHNCHQYPHLSVLPKALYINCRENLQTQEEVFFGFAARIERKKLYMPSLLALSQGKAALEARDLEGMYSNI